MIQDRIEKILREIWELNRVPTKILISSEICEKWKDEEGVQYDSFKYISFDLNDIPIIVKSSFNGDEIFIDSK